MKLLYLVIFGLIIAAPLSFAVLSDLGTFTCPSGQTEDLQCAASCCSSAGGQYSYSDETCEVSDPSAWDQAMQCEQASNCCVSASNGSSSGCCGSALVLLFAGAGIFLSTKK